MPELPDIVVYIEALEKRVKGVKLEHVRISSPFLLRTAIPPLSSIEGKSVLEIRRLGKRICFGFAEELWLVLHLMIAGRLHWYEDRAKASKARGLAVFEFTNGSLTLTEAGTQKRASLHVVQGEEGLEKLNPGGLEGTLGSLPKLCGARITHSNVPLPIPESSAASATLTQMKFFSQRNSHPLHLRKNLPMQK